MGKGKTRFLAMLLSLALVFSVGGVIVFAVDDDDSEDMPEINPIVEVPEDENTVGEEMGTTKSDSNGETSESSYFSDVENTPVELEIKDGDVAAIEGQGYVSLKEAVEAAMNGDTIEIIADIELEETVSISGKSITITIDEDATDDITIQRGSDSEFDGLLFEIENSTVTFKGGNEKNLILRGANSNSYESGAMKVDKKSTVTLGKNASVENFTTEDLKGEYIEDYEIYVGYVIGVFGGSTFVLDGGTISSNKISLNMSGSSYNEGGIISSYGGKISIEDGLISYSSIDSRSDAVTGTVYALKADVTMSGGTVLGNYATYFGGISVQLGTFNLSNGQIIENGSHMGGGIYLNMAEFNMTGGTVSGNSVTYGGGGIAASCSECNISGGDISYNTASIYGGGIYSEGAPAYDASASLNISGNVTISNNYANGNSTGFGVGGGIYLVDTNFTMNGGSITDNYARYNGGGIAILSSAYTGGKVELTLNRGKISNNSAGLYGGGIYLDESVNSGTVLYLYNVQITENEADETYCNFNGMTGYYGTQIGGKGGGIWICPDGEVYIYVTDGGIVTNNTADNAGDDISFNPLDGATTLYLADRVLGGGSITYYEDGANQGDNGGLYWDDSVSRFVNGKTNVIDSGTYNTDVSAHSVVSESDYSKAVSKAELFITGNTAAVGGGIAANSTMQIGTVEPEPEITKEIAEDDYERKEDSGEEMHDGEDIYGDSWGTWDDADNNQEITYQLNLTYIKDVSNLTVHDYLEDGLDFEPDTIDIVLYDGSTEGTPLVEGTDYTMTQGTCSDPECSMEGCTFEVKFDDSVFTGVSSDAYLIITYKAITDTHEEDYDEDYADEILNYSYMTYGVNTLRRSDVVTTATDLFGFGIYKYYTNSNGTQVSLRNAKFRLSKEENNRTFYAIFDSEYDEDGTTYYLLSGWTDNRSDATELVSGSDGMIRIEGLDDDTYTLTETSAPSGYQRLTSSIQVTISEYGEITLENQISGVSKETAHEISVRNVAEETTSTPETVRVGGTKIWVDDNEDSRPESITVRLYADGDLIDTRTVSASNNWSYSFTGLDKYGSDGHEIVYTIEEVQVPGYSTEYDGYNITNTYIAEEDELIEISVTKMWDDSDNADGIRPDSVTVELYLNGEPTDMTLTLGESNGWSGTFTDLPEETDGVKNVWSVSENAVEGYESSVSGDEESGFVITNTHAPDEIEVPKEPVDPDVPAEPENPEEPQQPETPDDSQEPSSPETPETPDDFEDVSTPETPENPDEQVTPATPAEPESSDSGSDLPQTGARWNLVVCIVMLAFGGTMLVVAGRGMMSTERRKRR